MGCWSTGDSKTDDPQCTSFDSCLQAANELRGMATDDRYSRSRGDASLEQSEVTATTVMGFASPDYPYYTARNERGWRISCFRTKNRRCGFVCRAAGHALASPNELVSAGACPCFAHPGY